MEKYIHPFITVCEDVFRDFVGTKLTAERPYISSRNEEHEWEISAIIGFTGEARGAVVISMKKEPALKITDILTGHAHTDIDNEVIDATGEIVNIIAGNAKRGLEETFKLIISLPTIVRGKNHRITWPGESTRIIAIPFKIFESDSLCLSVAIESITGA
ncbi:MAG: chemotaxis protein CheX [Spirochaetia bacterium]|nr:chemotaxis protein CheX [Spirochaetia bacterium]